MKCAYGHGYVLSEVTRSHFDVVSTKRFCFLWTIILAVDAETNAGCGELLLADCMA